MPTSVPTPSDHTYLMARSLRGCYQGGRNATFVLTPTFLFDMGFPTPSAGGGGWGVSYDRFGSANRDDGPVAKNGKENCQFRGTTLARTISALNA